MMVVDKERLIEKLSKVDSLVLSKLMKEEDYVWVIIMCILSTIVLKTYIIL